MAVINGKMEKGISESGPTICVTGKVVSNIKTAQKDSAYGIETRGLAWINQCQRLKDSLKLPRKVQCEPFEEFCTITLMVLFKKHFHPKIRL